jgi:dinuclear metal center YbgI/SA1388 family protein
MRVRDIESSLERWAPRDIAWEGDNIGLQVGSPRAVVHGILVCLDVTEGTIAEARRRRTNLIISHHPFLFQPASSVNTDSATGRCLAALLKYDIAVLIAHTNLDFTRGGTSHALGNALGLTEMEFLRRPYQRDMKLTTFVPEAYVDRVVSALASAGAGRIGEYEKCSFRVAGTGTFRGSAGSHPMIGTAGRFQRVSEVRLEMIVPRTRAESAVTALKAAHPYEEVAFDLYPLANPSADAGMGVIGNLPGRRTLGSFLVGIKRALNADRVRFTGDRRMSITRVAVCGGSGSRLLGDAIAAGAEALVTADVKYHAFHEAAGRIALIDAGHYETELPVVAALVRYLKSELRRHNLHLPVRATSVSTNPVVYV